MFDSLAGFASEVKLLLRIIAYGSTVLYLSLPTHSLSPLLSSPHPLPLKPCIEVFKKQFGVTRDHFTTTTKRFVLDILGALYSIVGENYRRIKSPLLSVTA